MNIILLLIAVILVTTAVFAGKYLSYPSKIRKAGEYLEEGDIAKASSLIKEVLEKKKDYIPARYIRAQILIKQNQYLLAISELNNILMMPDMNKYISELDIHYHLATLYNETRNWQKEIEEYKKILSFNDDDARAHYRIGHALYRQKDYKKVREHLTKALILDPSLKDSYLPLGIACFNISDYEKAEEYLANAITLPGDHSEVEYHLGYIYKMKKDYDRAVRMLENAKKSREFFIRSIHRLGEIFYEQGMFSEAIEQLESGLKSLKGKTDESLSYRYLLAECYENENSIREAVHHWEIIEKEHPNYRSTKLKLDSYKNILDNKNMMVLFTSSADELQKIISDIISILNYNIISGEKLSQNAFQYKTYNIKKINDPAVLIFFDRTTREITEQDIIEFYKRLHGEKCKSGIYLTTSKFSLKARASATSRMIEIYDSEFLQKVLEKIWSRKI